MASNQVPKKREQLLAAAEQLADGLKLEEVRLGVMQNTEEKIRSALDAALSANKAFHVLAATNASLSAARKAALADARNFIFTTRGLLENSLGRKWSPAWLPTGFIGNSLAVPGDPPGQQELLQSLRTYLEANPDKEVEAVNVTASKARAILESLKNTRAALDAGNSAVDAAKQVRKQKVKELRWRFSGLVAELRQLLDDEDSTWYTFGLSRPSDPETPAVPNDVSLTGGLPGTIFVSWAPARRAERYKVYKKEEGDAEFQTAATTAGLESQITGLKGGSPVEIQVSAINIAGESLPSIPVEIIVPPDNPPTVQG
jgi:hypothetical protein